MNSEMSLNETNIDYLITDFQIDLVMDLNSPVFDNIHTDSDDTSLHSAESRTYRPTRQAELACKINYEKFHK